MKPQKALHLFIEEEKKKPKYKNHNYMVFEKYDGWYGYYDSGETIRSRSMRHIPSVEHLGEMLAGKLERHGRLIFEILIDGVTDFPTLNGLLNRSVGDYRCKDAYLVAHDFIPLGHSGLPFKERYIALADILCEINHPKLMIADYITISDDINEWKSCAEEIWSNKGEGVILKRLDAPYSPDKRNYDLMKIKEEIDLDLLVVGYELGEGKYEGVIGSLICKDSKGIEHSVSGMTDSERFNWTDNFCDIDGKVIKVKAMKILPNGKLREARFIAVRYDKSEKDID